MSDTYSSETKLMSDDHQTQRKLNIYTTGLKPSTDKYCEL